MTDLYGQPERLSELADRLNRNLGVADRLATLTELAWYNRQRDQNAALDYLAEATDLLTDVDAGTAARHRPRQLLARGEIEMLRGALVAAEHTLAEAADGFRTIDDPCGLGDTSLCDAERLNLLGRPREALNRVKDARFIYLKASDSRRATIARIWAVAMELMSDGLKLQTYWQSLPDDDRLFHPAITALSSYVDSILHQQRSEFTQSIRAAMDGIAAAERAGLVWVSINLLTRIGSAFQNLGDSAAALEWKEKAYALASPTGWPEARATALSSLAFSKSAIGKFSEARPMLRESMELLSNLQGTRRYVITCSIYANVCLRDGDPAEALVWFEKARRSAMERRQQDAEVHALLGLARAQNSLGRPADGWGHLARALDIAQERDDKLHQSIALHEMARALLLRQRDGTPEESILREACTLMEEALEIGRTISGYVVRPELLSDLSTTYERLGDTRTALQYERLARTASERVFNKENADRMAAMEVRFASQRAREEAEHLKALAVAQTDRAEALDRVNRTLEHLGAIGQEITASLDVENVQGTLYRHLTALMEMPSMFIGLLDREGRQIDVRFRREDGNVLEPYTIGLDDPSSNAARAVRERQEILLERPPGSDSPNHIPGTRQMCSLLYTPLIVADRVIGVLSVQHDRLGTFGASERQIIRNISAYAAIALANAQAYASLDEALANLQEAQGRLVQQEKLASLGQLVAGVAHEVNTPVGILLSLASHLTEEVSGVAERLTGGLLRKSELINHLQATEETAKLMLTNAARAANLVSAFKQVAADRTNDEARPVELLDYLREVAATVQPLLRPRGVRLSIGGDPMIRVATYPGLLAQVVSNLVQNAVTHAFDGVEAPEILIDVSADPLGTGGTVISIGDNGVGMPLSVRQKAFEPFFTTRRDRGGTGLGLHVVHNVVTGPLQGTVALESEVGAGTRFILHLPPQLEPGKEDGSADHALTMALGTV
ncbi:MAG: hypothetical protein RLY86_4366 [Pseudomonadota bacterium]|jgi:signal transduction histidine kinase